jgi:hypothetical protein
MSRQTTVAHTLLNRDFQTEVRAASVTVSSFVYGYGNPEQMGLSGPNTTFFASMDNTTLEKWLRLLFGGVETGPRVPQALTNWKRLAPCILRLLMWFIRVEAITRCTARVKLDDRMMTTKCPCRIDDARRVANEAEVIAGRPPKFPSDRVRATVTPHTTSFDDRALPPGTVREVAYFKGAVLQHMQTELIPPRPRLHPVLCLPALAFSAAGPDDLTDIQELQAWHVLCAPFLWKTTRASGMLFTAVNDPAVYDDAGAVVENEDDADKHTLRVWDRLATEIEKACPHMEVVLRKAVARLVVDEERLIKAARAALVAYLVIHPAYDGLTWEPDTKANRECYGDKLVDAIIAHMDAGSMA